MKAWTFGSAERGGRYLNFALEREWSCPLHDRDVNEWDFDDDEELGRQGDDEFECNSCRGAGWQVVYDADGWATIVVAEEGPWGSLLRSMRAPLLEGMRHSNILLTAIAEHETRHLKPLVIPISTGTRLPRSAAADAALDA